MSTDNRTTLNDCSATTGWTGDDNVSVNTDAGYFFEGISSLSSQFSDSEEHMYTNEIGGELDLELNLVVSLGNSTCYMLIKDNLVVNKAGGGVKFVMYDGTNIIGYDIGGNDATGLALGTFYNSYRIDASNSAAFSSFAFSGSEASLSKTVQGVGYGAVHAAKAVGAIDNLFMDRFSYIKNTEVALTVNGGTSGTPESFADVFADDETGGWGLVANPQGSVYNVFGTTEFGDSGSTASYFSQADAQIFLLGQDVGATNFNMSLIANSSAINSFVLDNCVIVNLGTVSNWDMAPANHDILKLTDTQFVDNGTFTFPVQDIGDKLLTRVAFVNCGQVDPSTTDMVDCSFSGTTDANGALLIDEATTANMTGTVFTSDGTGHALYVRPTGAGPFTYTLTDWEFNGYGANDTTDSGAYINPVTTSADITFNVVGGGAPTIREDAGYTGTVTVNNSVAIEITVLDSAGDPVENARVFMTEDPPGATIFPASTLTDASGVASTTYNFSASQAVTGRVRKSSASPFYKTQTITGSIESSGFSATLTMINDE